MILHMRTIGRMLVPARCLHTHPRPAWRRVVPRPGRMRCQGSSSPTASINDKALMKVASWRLALLQTSSSKKVVNTDFSTAMRLKGVSFDNREVLIKQLQPGQGVIFCREPSNPADPHAVGVYTAGMQLLGYVPRHAAQLWPVQTCFGRVVSSGQSEDVGPWGALVSCKASIQGMTLDLLPDSWQEGADLQQALRSEQWDKVQQQVTQQYGNRCAISSMPAGELQQPLCVVPVWGFDYIKQQVQLAQLIPICQPLYLLHQQLAEAAKQLVDITPSLQLQAVCSAADTIAAAAAEGDTNTDADVSQEAAASPLGQPAAEISRGAAAAARADRVDVAAAAVASLTAEQQEAIKWLSILTPWPQVDCVQYLAYAGWRRQRLLQRNGWQLVPPDAEHVAVLLLQRSSTPATGAASRKRPGMPPVRSSRPVHASQLG